MSKIINLDDYRKDNLFAVLALCLEASENESMDYLEPCFHRWVAGVPKKTSLFKLECPSCGAQNSFASILPSEYLDVFLEEPINETP